MEAPHILVVEDDEELAQLLKRRIEEAGYSVAHAADGTAVMGMVEMHLPDLVILDVMLPGMDGLEVCRRLRARYPLLYIIMLTARAEELDRVVGLEVGADDYVTKPFSLQELMARIRATLRRLRLEREHTDTEEDEVKPLVLKDLKIDPMRREVFRAGESLALTSREFDLLLFLARHPGRPFTRLQLLEAVWNIKYEGYDRTVDSHIQRLRAKLERDPAMPQFIKTVWGVGYKFNDEEEA